MERTPLYLSVEDAAAYVGIGVKKMREFVNSADPPPHMKVGSKRMLETASLAPYFKKQQEVRSIA